MTLISTCTDASTLTSSVLLQKFMKGIFNSRPSLPKTCYTWDVEKLLTFLSKLSPPKALSLLSLSCKLATLLVLLTGQRGQSIHLLKVTDLECTSDSLIVRFTSPLKTTRPGSHLAEITLPAYENVNLCILTTFLEYKKRTKCLRSKGTEALFLATIRPHKAASRDTVSNWVRRMLKEAGIDMSVFTPHSTRAASTSAQRLLTSLSHNTQYCRWSQQSTFRRFYDRPIRRDPSFAATLLKRK